MVESPPVVGLEVLRAPSLAVLVDELAERLASEREDAFAHDVVTVPSAGVQRWVQQRLSRRLGAIEGDGICAGVEFTSVPALVAGVVEELTDQAPGHNPWRPAFLRWTVLDQLDAAAGQEWARFVTHHLGAPGAPEAPGRRMATAERLAALFARAAAERPAMVKAWSQGLDVDAAGQPLATEDAWQPALWRRLRDAIAVPDPVAQLTSVCARLDVEAAGALPSQLFLLTPPRVSRADRTILRALARHRRVTVALLDHAPSVPTAAVEGPRTPGSAARNRLNRRLGGHALAQRDAWLAVADVDTLLPATGSPHDSMLGRLRHAVATDLPAPAVADRPARRPGDDSVEVHRSHGADRQVEVLRDVLLAALQDDPSLEPRDIVVLSPQLETHAPLVAAAFGPSTDAQAGPAHGIRVRVADTTLREFNPILGALSSLLTLVSTRLEASAVLDFAALTPVSARLGLDADDLARLTLLVRQAGVRWGLDARHRERFGLGRFPQNTWRMGLDRMLAGVALTEEALAPLGRTTLPLDDVSASDTARIGALAALLAAIERLVRFAETPHPPAAWMVEIRHAAQTLTIARGDDAWQIDHAASVLAGLEETLPSQGRPLALGDIRVLLDDLLRGATPRAGFGSGALVVCSPQQVRHVPHRVCVLLGFDDAVFPRKAALDGDDLVQRSPLVADPDPRADDRTALLDAVMATTERLILIGAGASPLTNQEVPASVAVAELCAAVTDTSRVELAELTIDHPLQPFSPRAFVGPHGSFDTASAAGARALLGPQASVPGRWSHAVLPAPEAAASLELADLIRALQHPVKAHLRRLGLPAVEEETGADEMPLELDGLGRWDIGNRLLRLGLAGHDLARAQLAEWLRGVLPPSRQGERTLTTIVRDVEALLLAAQGRPEETPHDIDVELGDRRLRGLVITRGTVISEVSFSKPSAHHKLAGWIQLLALQAAEPGVAWTWEMSGKGRTARLGPVPDTWAVPVLDNLVALYDRALREPLPFLPKLAASYVDVMATTSDEAAYWELLRQKDYGTSLFERDTDAAFRRYFPTIEALRAVAPVAGDSERHRVPSRLGTLSLRVFRPLTDKESR